MILVNIFTFTRPAFYLNYPNSNMSSTNDNVMGASWTDELIQVWERGIRKIIILPWTIFIFMFLQCKECFIKCTFSVSYCLLCPRRSCCFKDGSRNNWFSFCVGTLLLLLAVFFTRYLEQISSFLFIQGLNLYPLEIMATA